MSMNVFIPISNPPQWLNVLTRIFPIGPFNEALKTAIVPRLGSSALQRWRSPGAGDMGVVRSRYRLPLLLVGTTPVTRSSTTRGGRLPRTSLVLLSIRGGIARSIRLEAGQLVPTGDGIQLREPQSE